ncbi:binding-protein-dependent transport systems inner membrane component [Candidatus Vecturithrix granuli]|uniref:Binding-protein-dependent transport systems inner membrane component n=1 Tax=Vecturithrix granuli TaxID=1499967 RepID=A0A081C1W3_VECG1|nr:binding-protein-dependent transport systems inner membrane component [Candidatus Vecturithrix granuli]
MTSEKRTLIEHLTLWFTWRRLIFTLLMTFFLVSILFPFYWMVSSSFKSYQEIGGRKPVYIPAKLRLDAFRELFDPSSKQFQNFQVNIINTLKVSIPTALIAVILSVFGAYSVARLSFIGKEFLLNSILLVYMFPGVLLIIPLFAMLSNIGAHLGFVVQDNLWLLVITYLAQTLPVALYMLTNYFRTIPDEIEQAALIDGCTRLQVIWRVTMPLAVPALVSVGIYTFMIAWNEFLYALVFLNSRELFTMPIKINTIFNDPTPRPHVVMAASTIMTIPIITLFLIMQRFLEEGLTAGGVKG